MQGFTTHSSLETVRLRLRVTNIVIRCKTLHNLTLVVCYSLILVKSPTQSKTTKVVFMFY